MRPAVSKLLKLHVTGVSPCSPGALANVVGMICAKGTGDPVATTLAMEQALKTVGASAIAAKCVSRARSGPFCRITAQLGGQAIGVMLSQEVLGTTAAAKASGVFISGGVGSMDDSGLVMPRGTPISLPAI